VIVGVTVFLLVAAAAIAACLVWRGIARRNSTSGQLGDDDVEMTSDIVLEPDEENTTLDASEGFGTFVNMLSAEDSQGFDTNFGEYDAAFDQQFDFNE
jgi:hypothetical protein